MGDLLRCYPRTYEDLSHPGPIRLAQPGQVCAVRASVVKAATGTRVKGGMTIYRAAADDGETVFPVTFFNNPYAANALREGETYVFYGRVQANFLKREMIAPECFPAGTCPAIRPVYRQTQGLNSRAVESAVRQALLLLPEQIRDPIPAGIREARGLCPLGEALRHIHFPPDSAALARARERLIYEELLVLQTGLLRLKSRGRGGGALAAPIDAVEEFWKRLPFSPTGAQRRAVREAAADMARTTPMNRLVQGDVGSGKTAVAAALCWQAAKNGLQAALMAPTELLARQHFATLSGFFAGIGCEDGAAHRLHAEAGARRRAGRPGGRLRAGGRGHARPALRRGVVPAAGARRHGRAAPLWRGPARRARGQGRPAPRSARLSTPIPRTLALMIYGDLDLSVLDELPPGRIPVKTYAIPSSKRGRAFGFVRRHAEAGRQTYIICPMIDEGDDDRASVTQYADRLRREWLPGLAVGELHGRMKPAEKEDVMARFAAGELSVLVSTTVVEVGVDVPNAAVMLIENAERYGLSQLHQLRGRVGRGRVQSYCILVTDAQNKEAQARMGVLCATTDGFRVADEDLRLRGPGDFFGRRQHGLPELRIADMAEDVAALRRAQEDARAILAADPALEQPEHRGLRGEVRLLFSHARAAEKT